MDVATKLLGIVQGVIVRCGKTNLSVFPLIVLLEADFEVGRYQTSNSETGVDLFQIGFLTAIIRLSPFVTNGDDSVPSGYNPIDKPLSPLIGGMINRYANEPCVDTHTQAPTRFTSHALHAEKLSSNQAPKTG